MTTTTLTSKSLQNESIVNRIVNQIIDAIIIGDLEPGDKLPPEPDLCTLFDVGRNSVREAIKILVAYGVVYIKRPDGTFVNDSYNQKMLDPMLYGILLQKNSSDEIIGLRKVLDIGIMQSIMHSVTPAHLKQMEAAYDALHAAVISKKPDCSKILEADIGFHMAITKACDNDLLLSMYTYVDRITIPSRIHAIDIVIQNKAQEDFIQLHEKIMTIIKEKDFKNIETTINEHYIFWKQAI